MDKTRISQICQLLVKLKRIRYAVMSARMSLPPAARRSAISEGHRGRYLVDEIEIEAILDALRPRIKRAERHIALLAPQIKTNTLDALNVGIIKDRRPGVE